MCLVHGCNSFHEALLLGRVRDDLPLPPAICPVAMRDQQFRGDLQAAILPRTATMVPFPSVRLVRIVAQGPNQGVICNGLSTSSRQPETRSGSAGPDRALENAMPHPFGNRSVQSVHVPVAPAADGHSWPSDCSLHHRAMVLGTACQYAPSYADCTYSSNSTYRWRGYVQFFREPCPQSM